DTPHERGAEGPASEQERSQRCARDSADDEGRVVQGSACKDTGQPAGADAVDIAEAATRQAPGYRERAPGDFARFWAQGGRGPRAFGGEGAGVGGGASALGGVCRLPAGSAGGTAAAVGTAP